MMEDRYMSSGGGSIFMSFLAGAVAGAAVALLTTPKRGVEVREQIKNWANSGKVGEAVHRATAGARRAFDDTISDINPDH